MYERFVHKSETAGKKLFLNLLPLLGRFCTRSDSNNSVSDTGIMYQIAARFLRPEHLKRNSSSSSGGKGIKDVTSIVSVSDSE
eukprot:g34792.t1